MTNLLVAALFFLSAPLGPQSPGEIPAEVISELDLTEAQENEIKGLLKNTEAKLIKYRGDVETKRLDLRSELDKDSPSETAVKKLAKEIGDIHTEMKILGLETAVKIKKILGPEKLKEAKKLMKEKRREMMRDRPRGRKVPQPDGPQDD